MLRFSSAELSFSIVHAAFYAVYLSAVRYAIFIKAAECLGELKIIHLEVLLDFLTHKTTYHINNLGDTEFPLNDVISTKRKGLVSETALYQPCK